jgi:hypothetical protein
MKLYVSFITAICLAGGLAARAAPTFADLAVVLAKGHFIGHLSKDASLAECVALLNGHGVCFPLFDVMDPNSAVTQEDFARGVGQSTLLFLGEAQLEDGCIKRPDEAVTWVDYCLLNDVDLIPLWNGFLRHTENGMLPEVKKFFGKGL